MRQSRPAANGYQALALAAPMAFSGTEGPEMPLRLFQGLSVALTHGVPWGTRWKFAFSPGSARLHECCLGMLPARNGAGNPDSPQAVIFLTSITDVMMRS